MTATWYDALMKYVDPNRESRKKFNRSADNWRDRFHQQNRYEAEGVYAGKHGDKREDCPYDKETNNDGWNFWVYGCENAGGELAAIERGEVDVRLYTTGASIEAQPPIMMPVDQAIMTGHWKPRYFTPEEALRMVSGVGVTGGLSVSGAPFTTGEDDGSLPDV